MPFIRLIALFQNLDANWVRYIINIKMSIQLLHKKLFIPHARQNLVPRSRLIDKLNDGLTLPRNLTLILAPAGFGKITLVSEWITNCRCNVAWLSLDEGDNDPARFLIYFVSSIRMIKADLGDRVLRALQSPQPHSTESILKIFLIKNTSETTELLNELGP